MLERLNELEFDSFFFLGSNYEVMPASSVCLVQISVEEELEILWENANSARATFAKLMACLVKLMF